MKSFLETAQAKGEWWMFVNQRHIAIGPDMGRRFSGFAHSTVVKGWNIQQRGAPGCSPKNPSGALLILPQHPPGNRIQFGQKRRITFVRRSQDGIFQRPVAAMFARRAFCTKKRG